MIQKPILNSEYPQEYINASKALLKSTLSLYGKFPQAHILAKMVANKHLDSYHLAKEAAIKVNCDPMDVMLANLSYDMLMGTMGCSTIVKQTENGPAVARNMDWFPPKLIANASAVIPTANGLNAAAPGLFGVVTGLSYNGFALVLNAAFGESNVYDNVPMLLFLRSVLDNAQDYYHALSLVSTTPLMSGGLITVVGRNNDEICVVERTPTKAAIRFPEKDQPLVVTNHYRKFAKPHNEVCSRFNFLTKNSSKDSVELLESVSQDITSQHIFIEPASNKLELFVPENIVDEEDISFEELLNLLND